MSVVTSRHLRETIGAGGGLDETVARGRHDAREEPALRRVSREN